MHEDLYTQRQGKANWALGLSLLSLLGFGLSAWLSCCFLSRDAAAVGAVLLMLPSIPLHWKGKKNKALYFYSFALNSIANGLIVAVYYLSFQIPLDIASVFLGLLVPAVLLLCAYLFFGVLQKARSRTTLLLLLSNFALMVGAVVKWVKDGSPVYSFCFFGLIFSLIYIIIYSVSLYRQNRCVHRDLSMGSYGIFAIIGIVVIVILSEGEALDCVFEGIGELISELIPGRSKKPKAK